MTIAKSAKGFGVPWEDDYGCAQAVKLGDTIYTSGQLSEEGNAILANVVEEVLYGTDIDAEFAAAAPSDTGTGGDGIS